MYSIFISLVVYALFNIISYSFLNFFKLVLLFSKKLTLEEIKNIKVKSIENETIKLWVYKEINSKFILINNNQPTFNSKYIASKELKIDQKTISKYLDTNKSYKDLFFYSQKL